MASLSPMKVSILFASLLLCLLPATGQGQGGQSWVTAWAGSAQGPYPAGSAVALPDQGLAIPRAETGARDQSMRMILRPSVWGGATRARFSNAFGSHPLVLDDVFVGVQSAGASLVHGTNRPVTFQGRRSVTIPAGAEAWTDPVDLPQESVRSPALLEGRKLAVSFHVVGESGPMTWHAKAMQTSYLSLPGTGSHAQEEAEASYPDSVTCWFFVDALDMRVAAGTPLVVCLGDSITDGTNSTLNGDDRWPDLLLRRFDAGLPNTVAVVDAGIGGNEVTGPAAYPGATPFGGGPSALSRLDRDVVSLSGVRAVIWFEGINDLSHGVSPKAVIEGLRRGIATLRERLPGVRVIGATITPALGAKGSTGSKEEDDRRGEINAFIRTSALYDGVLDFDRAVADPATGALRPAMVFNTTVGGAGDNLHPNRTGYLAIAQSIDLKVILPSVKGP